MRAIWSGAIGFGLVNIPVKLFSAVNESRLDFDMLDKKDHSHIKYKRVNEHTGKDVAWNNIVKGYDVNGKYVILNDTDFEKALPEKTKTITLETFVHPGEIDVILYDSAYYLQPAKGGGRAYALLEETLRKTSKTGIGTFVLRNKERPVSLRAANGILILHTLRFINEIRNPAELIKTKTSVKRNELTMAVNLVENMGGKFDIRNYKDVYTLKLMKFIKAKASGKKIAAPKKETKSIPNDLIAQLEQSLTPAKKTPVKKKRTAAKK